MSALEQTLVDRAISVARARMREEPLAFFTEDRKRSMRLSFHYLDQELSRYFFL